MSSVTLGISSDQDVHFTAALCLSLIPVSPQKRQKWVFKLRRFYPMAWYKIFPTTIASPTFSLNSLLHWLCPWPKYFCECWWTNPNQTQSLESQTGSVPVFRQGHSFHDNHLSCTLRYVQKKNSLSYQLPLFRRSLSFDHICDSL